MAGLKGAAAFVCLINLAAVAGCRGREPRGDLDLARTFATAEHWSDAWDLLVLCAEGGVECPGFASLEGSGVDRWMWMQARHASVRVRVHSKVDKVLRFRVRAHPSLTPAPDLTVSWNGKPLGVFQLGPTPGEFVAVVPESAQTRTDNVLWFDATRHHVPIPGEADRRRLVAAFTKIVLVPAGAEGRPLHPTALDGEVRLPPSTSVAYHLRLQRGSTLRIRTSAPGGVGVLTLRLDDDEKVLQSVTERFRGSRRITFPMNAESGSIVRLVLANEGESSLRLADAQLSWQPEPKSSPAKLAARPSIVVYLVDTLRADALGAYGSSSDVSPRFDAFAREALLFEDASSQASWTRPSVASLFTGLHVSHHGVDRETRALAESHDTLAEQLAGAGYRTCAFVANHLVDVRFGFAQGFAAWNEGGVVHDQPAADLVERGLRCAEAGRGPFFLYIHAQEPHSPYEPSASSRAIFNPEGYRGDKDTRALLRLGQLGTLAPDGLDFLKRRYKGEVRDADAAFGALVDGLRSRSLLASTLVIFTSDHGEEFREHGGTEHAKTLYQELIRVPLAVRLPGTAHPARRLSAPVELIDVMPTILSLLGLGGPSGSVGGRDRSSEWLREAGLSDSPVRFAEARFELTDKLSARVARFKLIVNNDDPGLWRAATKHELYDLADDPGERMNLFDRRPVTAAFLLKTVKAMHLAATQAAATAGAAREVALTPEDRERLRALGYVN